MQDIETQELLPIIDLWHMVCFCRFKRSCVFYKPCSSAENYWKNQTFSLGLLLLPLSSFSSSFNGILPSVSRSCLCSTAAPRTPLSHSLPATGNPSSLWTLTSGRDGCTCIALLSSLNMTCECLTM